MFHYMFLAVIVRQFLAWFDVSKGNDKDTVTNVMSFAIRFAAVVDIPRDVLTSRSIDCDLVGNLEQIHSPTPVGFFGADAVTHVFNDTVTFFDQLGGKESQAGGRFSNAYGILFHTGQSIIPIGIAKQGPAR